jgi:hypothetical protein
MSKKVKKIHAERQAPKDVPTPLKKQEPTASIWQQGGIKDPQAAIDKDKNDVRKPVGPGSTDSAGS